MTDMNCQISVVIKTYDDTENSKRGHDITTPYLKDYLRETLDQLSTQEYKPYEVIIVDSSKGDGINRLLNEHVLLSKSIIVKHLISQDFSHPKALNTGIRAAKGDIVVSLSGDATPVNTVWLKNLVSYFNDPKIAGVWGRQVKRPGIKISYLEEFRLWWRYKEKSFVSTNLSLVSNANAAMRKELALAFPYDETLEELEDYKWAKILRKQGYSFAYAGDALAFHSHVAPNLKILQRMVYYFYLRLLIDLGLK